ncbi:MULTISPECIES: helix-turn-helix domain-containing protein [Planktothrix]|nr:MULTISPECIES: helix-turn-helix transcriptional regulator [Planktothrix]CAD5980046.1 hypothetical protein NO758_04528 [Planktothrix agardhii]
MNDPNLILQVVFYKSELGNEPVREWLKSFQSINMNNQYIGSNFDTFLEEEGILSEVEAIAIKRVIAYQIQEAMNQAGLSKSEMAKRMNTSRSSLQRLLDPKNSSLNLQTITKAALVLGKKLKVEFVLESNSDRGLS